MSHDVKDFLLFVAALIILITAWRSAVRYVNQAPEQSPQAPCVQEAIK